MHNVGSHVGRHSSSQAVQLPRVEQGERRVDSAMVKPHLHRIVGYILEAQFGKVAFHFTFYASMGDLADLMPVRSQPLVDLERLQGFATHFLRYVGSNQQDLQSSPIALHAHPSLPNTRYKPSFRAILRLRRLFVNLLRG